MLNKKHQQLASRSALLFAELNRIKDQLVELLGSEGDISVSTAQYEQANVDERVGLQKAFNAKVASNVGSDRWGTCVNGLSA